MSFFNSIHLAGPELTGATLQAVYQNDRILGIMKNRGKMTPFQVLQVYNRMYSEVPITSIRRSMSVLTKQGLLEKCEEMKDERFGKPNHYWKVV